MRQSGGKLALTLPFTEEKIHVLAGMGGREWNVEVLPCHSVVGMPMSTPGASLHRVSGWF